jgi:hypothetical protein
MHQSDLRPTGQRRRTPFQGRERRFGQGQLDGAQPVGPLWVALAQVVFQADCVFKYQGHALSCRIVRILH